MARKLGYNFTVLILKPNRLRAAQQLLGSEDTHILSRSKSIKFLTRTDYKYVIALINGILISLKTKFKIDILTKKYNLCMWCPPPFKDGQ